MTEQVEVTQDKRRLALIERIGTFADLLCSDPLPGVNGDVAYDLLRQAAAQISSDRLRLAVSQENVERVREALRFYAEEWVQDVDAERTIHGWVGSIDPVEPTVALWADGGNRARAAIAALKQDNGQ